MYRDQIDFPDYNNLLLSVPISQFNAVEIRTKHELETKEEIDKIIENLVLIRNNY